MAVIGKMRTIGPLLGLLAALGGCGEDGTGVEQPEPITSEEITGDYSAMTMTTTDGGATTDQLAGGATLDLTLHADGTTTGRLFVPDGAEEGGDLDADLSGTFSFDESSSELTFEQAADTFVRDMTLTASRSAGAIQLEGERTFGSTTVRIVLR